MINEYTKVAAILILMWFLPHCSKRSPPVKTVQADVSLSVQEDCLLISINRRLCQLEATTIQPKQEKPTRCQPVPISASEAVNQ